MIPQIEQHRQDLTSLCRKFGVARLEIFGSAATAQSDRGARDVDMLVEFLPASEMGPADQYFGLLEALQSLLDRPVDLVCARAMQNPYFIDEVNRSRSLLYAA
ncbi:MAG: nucleotidyltransferase family protein [Phycisphaeraceae bacterium]